jgi:hypothetical protein
MADGTTVLCLYPLAVFCAATAIVALQTRALPRSLGAAAAVTAVALVANGCFFDAGSVPALLLFLVWTLVTSLYLVRHNSRESMRVSGEATAAA